MSEIRSIGKLCSILQVRSEYIFDLANRANNCYYSYDKKTLSKDGALKLRHIDIPNTELKNIQKRINQRILRPYIDALPNYVHGARNKKSIVTNATTHIKKEAILSLDIKDCFPSIEAKRIYYIFRNILHCSDKVAAVLTALTTKDGSLPQGCPTSASLCNLALSHTLENMSKIGKKSNLAMSQYIDDIFYSGNYKKLCKIKKSALAEIGKSGLKPNFKKIKISKNNNVMQVTGITVNTKLSAGKKKIHKIEREILKITIKDIEDYYTTLKFRKIHQKSKLTTKIRACKIEKILGEISNVTSINKQQGYRLSKKLKRKINILGQPPQ